MTSDPLSDCGTARIAVEIYDEDSGETTTQSLPGERIVIGRTSAADLTLASPRVSRRHAELLCDPFGRWWVRDLRSRNGIRLNGVDVPEGVMRDGDQLTVGPFKLTLRDLAVGENVATAPIETMTELSIADGSGASISSLEDAAPTKIDTTHLATLRKFADELAHDTDPRDRLQRLCRLMVRYDFPAQTAVIVRINRGVAEDPPQVLCEPESMNDNSELPYLSRSLLRAVAATGAPALAATGTEADPGVIEITIAPEADSPTAAMAAPVTTRAESIDLLYVTLPAEYASAQWLALVALAAQQYEQVESSLAALLRAEEHAAIERELERATQIQKRLVPRDPSIEGLDVAIGFKPCRWVGGDYVDVSLDHEGHVILVLADVTGKGLPAALVAGELHAMVHASLRSGADAASMMNTLNAHLCEYLEDGMFATMVCVVLDTTTGEMLTINAGHPPPIIIAPDGSVREMPRGTNPPLGVIEGDLTVDRSELKPGFLLALFSDGLTEMTREDGEMLYESGLAQELADLYRETSTVTIDELSEAVDARLDAIQGQSMQADDRTYLLARRL